ncbi:MAG TPA: PDZ domain-containing protein, partial [Pirellulaceae bacterium]
LNGRWRNNLPLNGVGIILNPGVAPGQPELVERLVLDRAWTGAASDLDGLKHLPEVVDVVLDGTRFDNDYLSRLALLPNLDRLLLRETTMDARGFQELAKLPKLQWLAVWYSPITDQELGSLEKIPGLVEISLRGTQVSDQAVQALAQRRPQLIVQAQRGAFLGVSPAIAAQSSGIKGVLLMSVTPDAAAERGGILPGDVIQSFDGQDVTTFDELRNLISAKDPGEQVELVIQRADERLSRTVELGKWRVSDWLAAGRTAAPLGNFAPQWIPALPPAVPQPAPAAPPLQPIPVQENKRADAGEMPPVQDPEPSSNAPESPERRP